MSTLREQYTRRKFETLKEHAKRADARLMESRRKALVESRAKSHFDRADRTLRAINEAKLNPQEVKAIAKAVKRLESIVDKLGGENGQMPNIAKMVSSIVGELNAFQGAGWWTKLMASMRDSKNPVTKASALEGLLSGGMEFVDDLLNQQGQKLKDEPISDQGPIGQNVVKSLAQAFDPGRISALSGLGGGKLSQMFGTSGSLGNIIAQDLANLKPSQLRAFAQQIRSVGAPAPVQDTTPQAAAQAAKESPPQEQAPSASQSPAGQSQQPEQSAPPSSPANSNGTSQQPEAAPQDDLQLASPDSEPAPQTNPSGRASGKAPIAVSTQAIQDKAGLEMAKVVGLLKKNDQKSALYYAARALQKLGLDVNSALQTLSPQQQQAPAKTGTE